VEMRVRNETVCTSSNFGLIIQIRGVYHFTRSTRLHSCVISKCRTRVQRTSIGVKVSCTLFVKHRTGIDKSHRYRRIARKYASKMPNICHCCVICYIL
jgi:hypothetical protein